VDPRLIIGWAAFAMGKEVKKAKEGEGGRKKTEGKERGSYLATTVINNCKRRSFLVNGLARENKHGKKGGRGKKKRVKKKIWSPESQFPLIH